ncbi:nucleolin [Artemisia annua]|uniref:Nucleolin n=1 Tax=Artemisia annua TaxID=35608 RepID=A0A2U1PBR8_ARTAN|nr:nucleolin [Artemisia annua]
MPPKTARKSVGGGRRGGRGKGPPKTTADPVVAAPVTEEKEVVEVKEEEVVPVKVEEPVVEQKVEKIEDDNDIIDLPKREDSDVKDTVEEFEKGERLDLEDNDPEESEPEEYVGEDDDEKEVVEDVQEEVLDVEEEVEDEDVGEDEEGDVLEGEMEDAMEELEPEEEEHAAEDHVEMVDADEQEHHDVFKERRKRKEFEIFVGGLDKDATEEDLRKIFSAVGEVAEVRLMMNAQTKKNKGFAFLRFATVEQAKRACVELKNPVVNGKQCGVSPSQDSDTLFLGNICKTWTKEALKEKLKNYGIDTVEDLILVEDKKNDGTNRGFAFLEFSSRSNAMDAFKRLQKRDVTFGLDRPAKVSFADSFIDPGDEIMAQVKTVFVDGLPASWDEVRVRELLKKYGSVEKIELARNMPSARRKDYGFVTFGTHDAAVTCAKSINNEELGEGDNKAKVRARLSRPLQRGKGKHVSRADFRPGRPAPGGFRGPWARPAPRHLPPRVVRRVAGRLPPVDERSVRRPIAIRDRRPAVPLPPRGRPVAHSPRSYDRRPPVHSHTKSSLKRDYSRREELPPRSRAVELPPRSRAVELPPRSRAVELPPRSRAVELPPRSRAVADYGPPRSTSERNSSYRDSYPARGPTYADPPRVSSHTSSRRAYPDDGYSTRFERPPPSYREGRPREYDPVPGSKRPYAALDDIPPRYAEAEVRQSRARIDYEMGGRSSQYGDAYTDRLGRSNIGYGSSRGSMSAQDSHGLYSSRGMAYSGGSYSGSEPGGMYSSSYGGDYISRGSDVGGSSYSSSLYSGRSMGGSGYMGGGSSGSYY